MVVVAISWMMAWWLTSGLPRQFCVMKANSRCSILFHLLVPGGRWQTVIGQAEFVGERLAVRASTGAPARRCCRRNRR